MTQTKKPQQKKQADKVCDLVLSDELEVESKSVYRRLEHMAKDEPEVEVNITPKETATKKPAPNRLKGIHCKDCKRQVSITSSGLVNCNYYNAWMSVKSNCQYGVK